MGSPPCVCVGERGSSHGGRAVGCLGRRRGGVCPPSVCVGERGCGGLVRESWQAGSSPSRAPRGAAAPGRTGICGQ